MLFDREIRFGSGTALVALFWGSALGLLLVCCATDDWDYGFAGVACSAMGAALMVIVDNCRTRRVVRGLALDLEARDQDRTLRPL